MRLPAASTAALLAALAVFLFLTERSMTSYASSSGLSACLAARGNCAFLSGLFTSRYQILLGLLALANVVPLLAGMFWGAPLIAREVEQGTHRLAWTQSATRRRWLAVKAGMFILGAILTAAILTAAFTWWSRPFARISDSSGFSFSRINPDVYDFAGIVPMAYMVFTFALGTAAGAFIRRTVPAMAVTIAGYLAFRVPLESLRGYLLPPRTLTYPINHTSPLAGRGDWVMASSGLIDKAGHPVSFAAAAALCPSGKSRSGGNVLGGNVLGGNGKCMAAHGFLQRDIYQPASRFWALQGIETGIVVAIALLLLAAAAWWTIRRIA
jgi:hypothetical protein